LFFVPFFISFIPSHSEVDSGIELGKTAHYENQIKALFRVLGADGTNFNKIRSG
jgi:hypothetical protein